MQDPHIQQMVGQNPQVAQMLQAAMSAHIAEHLGMEYKKEIEGLMGMPLPDYGDESDEDKEVPPEVEFQVSQLAAQAAQQLLAQHTQQAQQAQAARVAQDPIIQLQQQELALKAEEQRRKAAKDQLDAMLKTKQLEIERERIASQARTAGAQMAVKVAADKDKLRQEQQQEGAKAGLEAMKMERTLAHQKEIAEKRTKKGD
jgi:hypothetical protein